MNIKNIFSGILTPSGHNVLHTQYGDFNLAKASDRKRVNKMVIELQGTTHGRWLSMSTTQTGHGSMTSIETPK